MYQTYRLSLRTLADASCCHSSQLFRRFHNVSKVCSELDAMKQMLNNSMKKTVSFNNDTSKSSDDNNKKATPKNYRNMDGSRDNKKGSRDNRNKEFQRDNRQKESRDNRNKESRYDNKRGDKSRGSRDDKYSKKDGHSSRGNRNQKYDNRREADKKQKLLFLETGNDRDKDAAKRVISCALEGNSKGLVQLIKSGGDVSYVNVVESFQGVNLSEHGLLMVGNRNIKEDDEDRHGLQVGEKFLILKLVDRQLVVKQYGEYLSECVTEKLKLSNSSILNKQKKKDEGSSKEVKIVKIGWNISLNDLKGQKKFEIENHLKKGNDVELIIDDKDELDKENSSYNVNLEMTKEKLAMYKLRRKELTDVENTMRNRTLSIIDQTLSEMEGLPQSNVGEKKGFLESRMVLRVKGVNCVHKDQSKQDKKEQKRLEKAQKAEKMRLRREENERLAREKMKEVTV